MRFLPGFRDDADIVERVPTRPRVRLPGDHQAVHGRIYRQQ